MDFMILNEMWLGERKDSSNDAPTQENKNYPSLSSKYYHWLGHEECMVQHLVDANMLQAGKHR